MICFSRLSCFVGSDPHQTWTLPQCHTHVDVSIVDVHAVTVMNQNFTNPFDFTIEAGYNFAMLAYTTVCGFEMIRGDGTRVVGRSMEKKRAEEIYINALSKGATASLGSEATKDLFSIDVGNLLPYETVTIKLTFLTPLTDDERPNQIRFTFPFAYTKQYGVPQSKVASNALSAVGLTQGLSIHVTIQQAGSIKTISCPSHPIELCLGKYEAAAVDSSTPDSYFASANLVTPTTALSRDFVLIITADNLDFPRCFMEPSQDSETTAAALTFVPKFSIPDVTSGMEYIFVVDRSGSMDGTPIELLRQAMIVLLRGLPSKNTTFNIFSFGNIVDSLWKNSRAYTQASLEEATAHVDGMRANYGGTEIASALESAFASLPKDRIQPVSVVLLTDGDAWDVDRCQDFTREITNSPGAFVRVCTVGIGSSISTDTVESIARAGQGISIYLQDNEPMTGKLARLVRAARTPPVTDIEVMWPGSQEISDVDEELEVIEKEDGAPDSKPPISLYNESKIDTTDVGPVANHVSPEDIVVPPVQQAPLIIPGLFPGTRTQVYAIISNSSLPNSHFPSPILIRGKVMGLQPVELKIDLLKSMCPIPTLIHALAARALITDREDGRPVFSPSISSQPALLGSYLEADIVRLGIKYGLSSGHTSFVAVDDRPVSKTLKHRHSNDSTLISGSSFIKEGSEAEGRIRFLYSQQRAWKANEEDEKDEQEDEEEFVQRRRGSKRTSSSQKRAWSPGEENLAVPHVSARHEKRSNARFLDLEAEMDEEEDFCEVFDDREDLEQASSKRQRVYYSNSDAEAESAGFYPTPTELGDHRLAAVARLQRFDGEFFLSQCLLNALGLKQELKDVLHPLEYSDSIKATVLAVVWMRNNASVESQDMVEKAENWIVANTKNVNLENLKEWAERFWN